LRHGVEIAVVQSELGAVA